MTPKEAFKVAFLEKCAADGLNDSDALARIRVAKLVVSLPGTRSTVKQGDDLVPSWVNPLNWIPNASAAAWDTFKNYVAPAAIGVPPLLGVLGGYTLAQADDDTYDADDAKRKEEIAEMRRAISQLQRIRERQLQT